MAKNAAAEAAQRCQHWLDVEKAQRLAGSAAGPKVISGSFSSKE